MKALNNKYLKVKPGVVLTPIIERVIVSLDPYFEKCPAWVTSGLRTPADQLRIIRNALQARGLDKVFNDTFAKGLTDKISYEGKQVYAWQPGWSKLLNVGYIVNPPFTAEVLLDYFRPGSKENRKGKFIGQTPHKDGTAFDIGGGGDGINSELAVIQQALNDKVPGLKGFLAEHGNNAIHCDCL
jgi:hypothetical protein